MARLFVLVVVLASFLLGVSSHTWLDCTKRVGTECKGYARGFPGRLPGINVDQIMTYRIQPGLSGAPNDIPICSPQYQSNANTYSSRFYMAEAKAGEKLKMVWTPNGHQRPAQDPKTWSIHWSGKAGTQLTKRGQLNASNRIGEPVYFDAQCDGGAGDNCYGSFTIPPETVSGTYQFVWYWVFNRDPNSAGEEYTTCFDVKVSGAATPPPPPPTSAPPPLISDPGPNDPAPTEGRNGLEVVVVVTVRVPRSPSDLSANMTKFVEALAELLNIYNAKSIKQVQIHIDQSTMSPPMTVLSFVLSSEGGIDPVETALALKQIVDNNDPALERNNLGGMKVLNMDGVPTEEEEVVSSGYSVQIPTLFVFLLAILAQRFLL